MASNAGHISGHGVHGVTLEFSHISIEQFAVMAANMDAHFQGSGLFSSGDVTVNDGHPPLASNVDFHTGVRHMVAHAVANTAGLEHGARLQRAVFGMADVDGPSAHATATTSGPSKGKGAIDI